MKYIITERQYRLLSEEEDKVEDPTEILRKSTDLVYNFEALSEDWDLVLRLAKGRPFSIEGDLNLYGSGIKSLENLQSVGGFLNLYDSKIESLGNLKFVGGYLYLRNTPLSQKMTEEDIRNIPNLTINGNIYI